MQGKRTRKPTTSLRLPAEELEEIDAWVRRTGMRSRTELIERAIEQYLAELKETKVVVLRDWTTPRARAAIMKYLRGRRSAYVSDLMEALGMDPDMAFQVVDELVEEGAVDRAA